MENYQEWTFNPKFVSMTPIDEDIKTMQLLAFGLTRQSFDALNWNSNSNSEFSIRYNDIGDIIFNYLISRKHRIFNIKRDIMKEVRQWNYYHNTENTLIFQNIQLPIKHKNSNLKNNLFKQYITLHSNECKNTSSSYHNRLKNKEKCVALEYSIKIYVFGIKDDDNYESTLTQLKKGIFEWESKGIEYNFVWDDNPSKIKPNVIKYGIEASRIPIPGFC